MWNFLIVLIIAIVIWMLNPLAKVDLRPPTQVDKKTQSEVNQVVNEAQKQVDYARQMQQQQQETADN